MRNSGESVHRVMVSFDDRIPSDAQAAALMAFERRLRELTSLDCRVLKAKMGDDSKLRVLMTDEERNRI